MALTAARTELNVSLVGEDETMRMLEDAKKRMGELEAKTRSLTGATKAQTEAAKAQQQASGGLNSTLGKLGEGIAKPLEGIGKLKEALSKGVEVFGFLGSAVTGAITGFEFLVGIFDDSEEKAAELTKALEVQKKQLDATKDAANRYSAAIAAANATAAGAAAGARSDAIKLAKLTGDLNTAAQLTAQAEAEQAGEAANKTRASITAARKEGEKAAADVEKFNKQSKAEIDILLRKEDELKKLKRAGKLEDYQALKQEYDGLLARNDETQKAMRAARNAVTASEVATVELQDQLVVQEKLTEVLTDNLVKTLDTTEAIKEQNKEAEKPVKPRGGGGGRREPKEDEAAAMRAEALLRRAEADEIARVVKALYEEQQAREANEAAMLSATKLMRDEVGATLPRLRQQMKQELATLPGGELFDSIRRQLEEQVKAVDAQMAEFRALASVEDADLLAQATDKQVESLSKLQQAYLGLGEARAKAIEQDKKLREQLERDNLAGYVDNFKEALEALSEVQAPAFEAISASLAGVSAQMGKFKDGQQSLTAAIVGSAGAIAGAVADKVASVRVEAGIRALFETAMGFATLGNPAESVGHFTAAAMFGLVAGGVIPAAAKAGTAAGGQKAPAKEAMATREGALSAGGGQVTNVYNLNTGIVDGQSTAMAFRRAELQARNTGMASAGGW